MADKEKYFIPVTFTSKNPGVRKSNQAYETDKYYLHPEQVPADFRTWLDDEWYEKKTLLIRHFMSKMYIKAPMPKVYNKLMTILERRDARHWSSDSKIRTIDIIQPNNDVKVTISDY